MNYKDFIITKGSQELGVLLEDIQMEMSPRMFKEFSDWIGGQTIGCLDSGCKVTYVYTSDIERFLRGNSINQ